MPSNFGIFTEEEMAMAINNKRVCELPNVIAKLKITNYAGLTFTIFGA